ncbi:hypothetical protein [Anatilimnocola floriformis]|uniref:hypothetical protein n=1 Tax=Anatilimnocola floriformis TaxID=2948575 RepID=UPI0020C2EF96|nr:hypothetical protein [Anatilimnocola floriformis]
MPAEIAFDPDVFHGELTVNRAQVFVRAPRSAELADCTLHGYVHGPRCEFSHTLPAKYVLTDLGAGPTLLARTTITDPCYWTSDLPHLYDVHIELRRGSEVLASEKRQIGLRGIGAKSSGELVRESKVWVPRGVAIDLLPELNLVDHLRSEALVGLCSSPSLDLLNEASRRGACLIVAVSADRSDFHEALRSLARWPAVMMAIVHGETLDSSLRQVAPNLLLAQQIPPGDATIGYQPAPWAHCIVVDEAGPFPKLPLPVLALRIAAESAGRSDCDQLQRDLAPRGQFAGYLVDSAAARSRI